MEVGGRIWIYRLYGVVVFLKEVLDSAIHWNGRVLVQEMGQLRLKKAARRSTSRRQIRLGACVVPLPNSRN